MNKKKENQSKDKEAAKLLNEEVKTKYPKGSYIIFSATFKKGENPATTSCTLYNPVNRKHTDKIVSCPPEWQNITMEKADEIAEMFDECQHINMVFV